MDEGVGRLAIKGPTGCRYLDDPRQRDYVVNGWNVTGDTYRRDADGYYWYLARSDDMIVSSGYNIGAPEVENALLSHPAVAECAVIGVPCPERGQKVKAFVVLAADRGASRRAGRGAAGASPRRRSRPTNIRARSSSSTRCRRPRRASSGGASCGIARWQLEHGERSIDAHVADSLHVKRTSSSTCRFTSKRLDSDAANLGCDECTIVACQLRSCIGTSIDVDRSCAC